MRSVGRFPPALMATFLVAAVVAFSLFAERYLTLVGVAENWTADWFESLFEPFKPQQPDIVLLTITENTLARFPFRSPIDRAFLAKALDTLAQRQVRGIGMDILFDQPTIAEADQKFLAAAHALKVPLVVGWTDRRTQLTEQQFAFEGKYLEGIRAGFVNMFKDPRDGTVREAFPGRHEAGVWRGSLTAVLAEALGHPQNQRSFRIHYRLGPDLETPPFRAFPIDALPALPAAWLKDKVVLIGADLPFDDRHRTPFATVWGNERGTVPGLFIQAQMLAQRMAGKTRPGKAFSVEIAIAFILALAAIGIAAWEKPMPVQITVAGVAIVALWAGAAALYWETGIVQPVIAPSAAFAIGLFSAVSFIGHRRNLQGKFVREAFSRYVSPGVLKRLEAHPDQLSLGGDKRDISLIFTDIEGFTTFAEKQEPTVLIGILNRYLDTLCAEVHRYEGTIDKFIGDAVMAVFGAPEAQADHAARALACARAMRDAATRLQVEFKAQNIGLGRTRIGVHSGTAIVGNVGGEQKFNYTAIGDVVNTASRLEGANKYFGTELCVSGATRDAAGPESNLRPIGSLVVKGRGQGLPVFTAADGMPPEQLDRYLQAYDAMAKGDAGALTAFEGYLMSYPDDQLARWHLERLQEGAKDDLIVLEGK